MPANVAYEPAKAFYSFLHLFTNGGNVSAYDYDYTVTPRVKHVVVLSMDALRSTYNDKPVNGKENFYLYVTGKGAEYNVADALDMHNIVLEFTPTEKIVNLHINTHESISWYALWQAGHKGTQFIKVMRYDDYINMDSASDSLSDLAGLKQGSLISPDASLAGAFVEKVAFGGKAYDLDAGEVTIKTKIGELIVKDDGTYDYGIEKGAVPVGDSRTDRFTVTIQGPDGDTETVPLTVLTSQSSHGTAGDDVLSLTGSGKIAYGLGGNDRYVVDEADDAVVEAIGGGYDTLDSLVSYHLAKGQEIELLQLANPDGTAKLDLTGNAFRQMLIGNAGENRLDGGAGADLMIGGKGNDTYVVDDAGDIVLEKPGEGFDLVEASVSYSLVGTHADRITLTGTGNIDATGQELSNLLIGNAGNNVLDGKANFDLMVGRGGNDTYIVDHVRDVVREKVGEGVDRVITSVSYALLAGEEIERIDLAASTGTKPLKLTGNEFAQTLRGNGGDNVLDGRGGADAMAGGDGNDIYGVDQAGDRVYEGAGGGYDRVFATSSYALKAGQEIEGLQLLAATGRSKFDLAGNEFGQVLVGNNGANALDGKGGGDALTGRGGADTFVFSTALGAGNVDRIVDFAAEDTIRLSKSVFAALAPGQLKTSEFKDIAKAKVDADDHILYDSRSGDLFYDADGSGKAAAVKFAVLDNKAALTHSDVLIA